MSKKISLKTFAIIIMASIVLLAMMPLDMASASTTTKAYKKYMHKLNHKVKVPFINGYSEKNMEYVEFEDNYTLWFWKTRWTAKKKKVSLKQFKYYKIINLDGDKKPELVLSKTSDALGDGHILICKYIKGKVKPIFCAYGLRGGIYKAKNKQIAFVIGSSGTVNLVFAKIKGGKVNRAKMYCVGTVKSVTPYYKVYYEDDYIITKSEYRAKYKTLKKPLKFKKIK